MSEAHQVYTVWEENPLDIINMSKGDKVPFSPTENDDDNDGGATKPLEESEQEATQLEEESLKSKPPESASDSITIDNQQQHNSTIESASSPSFEDSQPTVETDDSLVISKNPQSSNSVPLTLQQPSPQASQARSGCKSSVSSTDRHTYSYRVSATSSIKYTPKSLASIKSGRPWYAVSKVTTKRTASLTKHKEFTTPKAEVAKNRKLANDKSEQQKGNSSVPEGGGKKEERRDSSSRSKYSSSELQTIQSRIKDSLQQQGVVGFGEEDRGDVVPQQGIHLIIIHPIIKLNVITLVKYTSVVVITPLTYPPSHTHIQTCTTTCSISMIL